MVGFYSGDIAGSASQGAVAADLVPAEGSEVLGASLGGDLAELPSVSLLRERGGQINTGVGGVDDYGNPIPVYGQGGAAAPIAPTMLDAKTATERYGIPGLLKFDQPIAEETAAEMQSARHDAAVRADVIARSQGSLIGGAVSRTTFGFLAGLLDPLNLAANFVPGLPEAKIAAAFGDDVLGRTVSRALAGASQGIAGQAALLPLGALAASQQGEDFGMGNTLSQLAFGGLLGGAMHTGIGAIVDKWGGRDVVGRRYTTSEAAGALAADPELAEAVTRTAVAQMAEGRPVEIEPVIDAALAARRESPGATAESPEPSPPVAGKAEAEATGDAVEPATAPGAPEAVIGADHGLGDAPATQPSPTGAADAVSPPSAASAVPEAPALPGQTVATPEPTAPAPTRQPKPARARMPMSLLPFLASRGGLALDEGGDLRALDAHKHLVPGRGMLVRKAGGLALDDAREAAEEAGYLPQGSGTNDLLDAVGEELHGNKQYSVTDQGAVLARQAADQAEEDRPYYEAADQVRKLAADRGIPLSDEAATAAAIRIVRGEDPSDALAEATGDYNDAAAAQRSAIEAAAGKPEDADARDSAAATEAAAASEHALAPFDPKRVQGLEDAQDWIARARDAGALSAADEAELKALEDEWLASEQRRKAYAQAAACITRGGAGYGE